MRIFPFTRVCLLVLAAASAGLRAQPDPKEIPLPEIKTPMGKLPGVAELSARPELPDVLTMSNGTRVSSIAQWQKRRAEMKRILEYYAVGQMPPPPGNVKGRELKSETVLDGAVKYRLIHLTFGPDEKLSLDIGVFTPTSGGPFPAIIQHSGNVPGATALPRLPQGPPRAAARTSSSSSVPPRPTPPKRAANPAPMPAAFSAAPPPPNPSPSSVVTSSSAATRS